MQWWDALVDWWTSDEGWRVVSTAILPFLAILVAGLVAAFIGRGAIKRVLAHQERNQRAAAVASLVVAGRKASTWNSLIDQERTHAEALASEAEVRVRMLPARGSALAANWAEHQLIEMRKHSSIFTFRANQTFDEFRDRLVAWEQRPSRAKKLFKADLERWRFDEPDSVDLFADEDDTLANETSAQEARNRWAPPAAGGGVATAATPVDTPEPLRQETESYDYDDDESDESEEDSADRRPVPPPVTASVVRERIAPKRDEDAGF